MNFEVVLAACLVAGVVFAAMAVWLTTRKGNTISDVLNSQHFQNAEALRVEVLDKVKVSSNLPIVGLYLVAAVVAIGFPAFLYWYSHRASFVVVFLSGSFQGAVPASTSRLYVVSHDSLVDPGAGSFTVPLVFRDTQPRHDLMIESRDYLPVGVSVTLDRASDTLKVRYQNSPNEASVHLQNFAGELPASITLSPAQPLLEPPPNQPSPAPALPATLAAAVPPAEG